MKKMENNLLDENVKERIRCFLIDLDTPGKHPYRFRKSPYFIYPDLKDVFNDSGLIPPALTGFTNMLSQFQKDKKHDPDNAIDNFISSLTVLPRKGVLQKHSLKKVKQIKDENYKDLKALYDCWHNMWNTEVFQVLGGSISLGSLIEDKSYFLEKYIYKSEQAFDYITECLNIDGYRNKPEVEKIFYDVNEIVMGYIKYFRVALEYQMAQLLEKYTQQKDAKNIRMWFVDVFDKYSIRFLPDWEQYKRKSYNSPDFRKSCDKLLEFLSDKHPRNLGYTRNTWHHFGKRVSPQGKIWLLYGIYLLLYHRIDREWLLLKEKANQIDIISKGIPQDRMQCFLDSLGPRPNNLSSKLNKVFKDPPF